jgi:hypothetical protein
MQNFQFQVTKATDVKVKARIGIDGNSGSGKTWTALMIARALAEGEMDKVLLIDTENKSSAKYAPDFGPFDLLPMQDDFNPARFAAAIRYAYQQGYEVVIVDSLSHAWSGKGGALQMVDKAAARKGGNTFAAWGDVTPAQNDLIDALLQTDIHLIATMRTKSDYAIEMSNGKAMPKKIGLKAVQRDGMEYEFDIMFRMEDAGRVCVVTKSRCSVLANGVFSYPNEDVAQAIRSWLESGEAHLELTRTKQDLIREVKMRYDADQNIIGAALRGANMEFDPDLWDEMLAVIGAYVEDMESGVSTDIPEPEAG